ncbi:MAG: hypothetical protein ACPLRR_09955 [Candidatus Saccharicenans sp.]
MALPQGVRFHRFQLQVNTFLFFSQETEQLQDISDNLAEDFLVVSPYFLYRLLPGILFGLEAKTFPSLRGKKE